MASALRGRRHRIHPILVKSIFFVNVINLSTNRFLIDSVARTRLIVGVARLLSSLIAHDD
jgi:hypothetical protein